MRRSGGELAGLIVAVVALLLVGLAPQAAAHDPAIYYGTVRWPSGVFEPYFIATGVPTQTRVTTAITNGAAQWNNVNEPMRFSYQGRSTQSIIVFPNCPANGHSYVFQRDISGDLANAYTCNQSGNLNSFIMTFDINPGGLVWHSDTTAPPQGSYDRWSTASHEFGHATGFGASNGSQPHWPPDSTRCVENSTKLTMCPTVAPATSMMRDLGDHDIHTFQDAY